MCRNFCDFNLKVGDCYSFDIKIDKTKIVNNDIKYICEVEISNNINTWLISGFNKFLLDETKKDEVFSLQLIPIKRGYLKYPKIVIKTENAAKDETETIPRNTHISEFININETVIVI